MKIPSFNYVRFIKSCFLNVNGHDKTRLSEMSTADRRTGDRMEALI